MLLNTIIKRNSKCNLMHLQNAAEKVRVRILLHPADKDERLPTRQNWIPYMELKNKNFTKIVRIALVLFTVMFSINSYSMNCPKYSSQSDVFIFEISETPCWDGYKENNLSSPTLASIGLDGKFIFSIKTGNLNLLASSAMDSYSEIFFVFSDLPPPLFHT